MADHQMFTREQLQAFYQMESKKVVSGPLAASKQPHYALLIFEQKTVFVPGDERSRQAPGHGYPEHTETYNSFKYLSFQATENGRQEMDEFLRYKVSQEPRFLEKCLVLKVSMTSLPALIARVEF